MPKCCCSCLYRLYFVEYSAVLKLKFLKLQSQVIRNVNAADIVDFLFRERVLAEQDLQTLYRQNDPQKQCRDLLALLHTSENPEVFVQLYRAIKHEPHLQWLTDRIDEYSDQSVIELQAEERYVNDKTGKRLFSFLPRKMPARYATMLCLLSARHTLVLYQNCYAFSFLHSFNIS